MATLTYYVNTDAATDGTGTSGSPFKTITTFWSTSLGNSGDTLTVYCSGAADDVVTGPLNTIANLKAWQILNIIGNATSGVYDASKYTLSTNWFLNVESEIYATFLHTWRNLQIINTGTVCIDYRRPGDTLIKDTLILLKPSTTLGRCIKAESAYAPNLKMVNCVVTDSLADSNYSAQFGSSMIYAACTVAGGKFDFYNCVFHLTKMINQVGNFSFFGSTINHAVKFKNCFLFHNISDSLGGFTGTPTSLHNCLISNSITADTQVNVTTKSGTSYDVTTQFNNYLAGDYSLKPTAVDFRDLGIDVSSENLGITTDIAGNARGAVWDIGPFEYIASSPYPDVHDVTDISQAADPECIYYGQTPAITTADRFSFENVTVTNGWPVSIDTQGFPIIDTDGATGTDSFKFNISRDAGSTWAPTPPAANTWTFTIAADTPVLLTVNGGAAIKAGQTNIAYTGTGLGASTAARKIYLTQGAIEVEQAQVTGNATGGTFNATGLTTGGKLAYGAAKFKVVLT